jgi:ParB family transcriptional regulator, chromosome partitioning protein
MIAAMQQGLWPELLQSAADSSDDTGGDEAYTPPWLVEAARRVLGTIDLDPASCATAQTVVHAATWYGAADDGRAQPWQGRMWLNPPYSEPEPWIKKVLAHWRAGDVPAALILVRGDPSTDYNRLLAWSPALMCMLKRVDFWPRRRNPKNGRLSSPDFPVLLWHLGADAASFRAVFDQYGPIR